VSFEEKNAWTYGLIAIVIPTVYFTIVLGRAATTPVAEIDYQWLLLGAIGAAIVASIVLAIITAMVFHTHDQQRDQRDNAIGRRGDMVGFYVMSIAALGPLVLALVNAEQFWIANSLYACFTLAALVSTVVKLVAYRRGF
jgi:hypothetical protein